MADLRVDRDGRLTTAALRAKIAWLCHLARAAAIGWAAWALFAMMWVWLDPAKIAGMLGRYLNADLGVLSPSQVAWGVAAQLAAWIPMAAVAYCIARLFGTYLGGRIFTVDATVWLLRIGIAGLITVAIAMRRIVWLILTSHAGLPLGTRLSPNSSFPTISSTSCFPCSCWRSAMFSRWRCRSPTTTPASCDDP